VLRGAHRGAVPRVRGAATGPGRGAAVEAARVAVVEAARAARAAVEAARVTVAGGLRRRHLLAALPPRRCPPQRQPAAPGLPGADAANGRRRRVAARRGGSRSATGIKSWYNFGVSTSWACRTFIAAAAEGHSPAELEVLVRAGAPVDEDDTCGRTAPPTGTGGVWRCWRGWGQT
jgi:hypothetical protein